MLLAQKLASQIAGLSVAGIGFPCIYLLSIYQAPAESLQLKRYIRSSLLLVLGQLVFPYRWSGPPSHTELSVRDAPPGSS